MAAMRWFAETIVPVAAHRSFTRALVIRDDADTFERLENLIRSARADEPIAVLCGSDEACQEFVSRLSLLGAISMVTRWTDAQVEFTNRAWNARVSFVVLPWGADMRGLFFTVLGFWMLKPEQARVAELFLRCATREPAPIVPTP